MVGNWLGMFRNYGIDTNVAENAIASVVAAYSSGDRYYHNLKHVDCVLNTVETLQGYTKNFSVVQLAALLHDVVYDTHARDNEEKSAEFAGHLLGSLGLGDREISTVRSLILNTKTHICSLDDCDCQVLIDADLAILGADWEQYWEYAIAIRQEYAWVDETEYVIGRRRVLERFLERSRIYYTPLMFEVGEDKARSNILAEIVHLRV